MTDKNKESTKNSEPIPEIIKKFYHLLRDNGQDATSGVNPNLFAAMNDVCHGVDLPYEVTIGKYWSGSFQEHSPTESDPDIAIVSALGLGEVTNPISVVTENGRMSRPVGMIELQAAADGRDKDSYDSSYFTVYADGVISIEGMVLRSIPPKLAELMDAFVPDITLHIRQIDFMTETRNLNEDEKKSLIANLESTITLS